MKPLLYHFGAEFEKAFQEHDRGKTPILFVHGSGGNPTNFRFLIEGLDRPRYQPWVYFYNDGTVSLASELDPRAQVAARRTFGFNEDHGGILWSPAVSQMVHAILSNNEVQAPWVERKIE